ncbi:MAG: ABC transporter ATP-binding protein [Alphaproteobacteria bacterium]|nr:ABC transporter ATP-binding protein [Alphaproteobacteria bacterium]
MTLLAIRDLRVEYTTVRGTVAAIPELSLEIGAGEAFGLVGESGCGKSTLIMAIMGYLGRNGAVARGQILFEGRDLVTTDSETLRRLRGGRIAIVYQEPATALNPSMTIGRQLMEVPRAHGVRAPAEARERAARALADVHLPDPESVMRRYPHQLSGGQKQRVVIAMALLANPALLLLDEPTTGLDVTVEAVVLDLLNELRQKYGTALFYISHNLGVIAQVCERIGVMYAGRLVEEAPAAALFARPRHPYTRGLLASLPRPGADKRSAPLVPIPGVVPGAGGAPESCGFVTRCAHARPGICDLRPVPMLAAAPGHGVRCARWAELPAPPPVAAPSLTNRPVLGDGTVVMAAHDLSRVFPMGKRQLVANDRLEMEAQRGHVLALVGESGSGKTTFAKVLAGLDVASGGSLRVLDADVARRPVRRRGAAEVAAVQMVFQNPDGTLNPSHPVGWPLARSLRKFGIARGRRDIEARVAGLLEMVRLPPSVRHALPRQLSGGQKQRIAIARAFAGNPQLLIADEPVSALDVSVQAAVINLLLRIQAEHQTTLVFISHDLGLVRYIADEVVVMYLGQVMESGPVAALFDPPYHPYTEALLSAVPVPDPTIRSARIRLAGEIPSPLNVPKGCRFATRCPRKLGPMCDETPPPRRAAGPGHRIHCHIPLDDLRMVEPVFRGAS